jgi:hypothetical protein
LVDDAGGRFSITPAAEIVTGAVATDYETGTSHTVIVRETLAGAANSPRDTLLHISVSDVED